MPHTKTAWVLMRNTGTGMNADHLSWTIRTEGPASDSCKENPDICEVFTMGGSIEGEEEGRANAHLLLSAPLLLECLQELSAWMRLHTGPADGTKEMLTRALDAIRKTGEQPRDSWE